MIEPQSAQLGASAWVWKLTLVAPRLRVMAGAVLPFPTAFPLPLAACPLPSEPLVAMTVSGPSTGFPASAGSVAIAWASGSVAMASDAGGGDAGADAGSAATAGVAASAGTTAAEPGEDTGTSATTAVRSMRPRLALSSVDRNREPSQRKM